MMSYSLISRARFGGGERAGIIASVGRAQYGTRGKRDGGGEDENNACVHALVILPGQEENIQRK